MGRRSPSWPRHAATASAALLATALAACSTAPAPRLHTLMPADPPARSASAPPTGVAAVLEPIRLPVQVDQPQWLVRFADGSLAVLEQERWASPLRDELREALREMLIAGWGMTEQRPAVGSPAAIRIAIDIRRFDSALGSGSRLEGSWRLVPGDVRSALSCEWFIFEPAAGDMAALATAHRRAVAKLASDIGVALAGLSQGTAARCPTPTSGA